MDPAILGLAEFNGMGTALLIDAAKDFPVDWHLIAELVASGLS